MTFKTALVALCAISLIACGTPAKVSAPTSTAASGTVLALDAIEIGCAAAVPNVSPAAAAWLATCPTIVTTTINAIEANNGVSAATAITTGLQQFLAQAPTVGLAPQDVQIIASITAAVNQFLVLYQQQTVSGSTVSIVLIAWPQVQRIAGIRHPLTTADRKQLEATKKRAAKTAKKLKNRHVGSTQAGPGGAL